MREVMHFKINDFGSLKRLWQYRDVLCGAPPAQDFYVHGEDFVTFAPTATCDRCVMLIMYARVNRIPLYEHNPHKAIERHMRMATTRLHAPS
jgi:hypothetical protein